LHTRLEIADGFLACGDPHDPIGKRILYPGVPRQRLREDGLTDAAHALEGRESDARSRVIGHNGIPQTCEFA
jgi:hypothetical protein